MCKQVVKTDSSIISRMILSLSLVLFLNLVTVMYNVPSCVYRLEHSGLIILGSRHSKKCSRKPPDAAAVPASASAQCSHQRRGETWVIFKLVKMFSSSLVQVAIIFTTARSRRVCWGRGCRPTPTPPPRRTTASTGAGSGAGRPDSGGPWRLSSQGETNHTIFIRQM